MKKLVIHAIILILIFSTLAQAECTGDVYSGSGNWIISNPTYCNHSVVKMAENADVTITSQLIFENTTLVFNSTTAGGSQLTVNSGSTSHFKLNGSGTSKSKIYNANVSFTAAISINGALDMRDTEVQHTTITITNDDHVNISNCKIYDTQYLTTPTIHLSSGLADNMLIENSNITAAANQYHIRAAGAIANPTASPNPSSENPLINTVISGNTFSPPGYGVYAHITKSFTFIKNSATQIRDMLSVVNSTNLYLNDNSAKNISEEMFYMENITNVNIYNNTLFRGGTLTEMRTTGSKNINIIGNTVSNCTSFGMSIRAHLGETHNIPYLTIKNNVFRSLTQSGIRIAGTSAHSIIENNTILCEGQIVPYAHAGLHLSSGDSATNSTATKNTIIGNFTIGLLTSASDNGWTVSENYIDSTQYGLYFGAAGNTVRNSIIQNTEVYDLVSQVSGTNTVLNTTHDEGKVLTDGGDKIIISKYYFNEYVKDIENNPVSGAQVSIYRGDNTLDTATSTDETGYIPTQQLTQYWANSTDQIFYSNYLVNTTFQLGSIYNTTTGINMTQSYFSTVILSGAAIPEFSSMLTLFLAIIIVISGIVMVRKRNQQQ